MLAWRSFLRRSSPLASRLGPARRRHDATKPVANRPASATKGHLYMVLDDHKSDYGIYKLDVDADLHAAGSARWLPRPAIRLEVPKIGSYDDDAQFAAAGGCIIATGQSGYGFQQDDGNVGITIVYDTQTPALHVPCGLPEGLLYGHLAAVPVGDRLYAFDIHSETWKGASFHCLTTRDESQDGDGEGSKKKQMAWGQRESGSSRCSWSDTGRKVVDNLPFSPHFIAAQAVLPGPRPTIYVSGLYYGHDAETFAYDTTTCEWTECGSWALPFVGAAAGYDAELGAWVGLHAGGRGEGTGHLCACRVPAENGGRPGWRVGGQKMLLEDDPDWRHVHGGAKLVHMGDRGEYCLFERLRRREGAEEKEGCLAGAGGECLLLLTTFRVGYDEAGHLTATDRRTARYKVSRYRSWFEAQAFWI